MVKKNNNLNTPPHNALSNNRLVWLDMARGISMMLVVYGHTCTDFTIVNQWICSFFIGLFFISGGYTYHKKCHWLKSNFLNIYLPYLFWGGVGIAYAVVKAFACDMLDGIDIWHKLYELILGYGADNYPLWFLVAFFVSKTIYDIICAIIESRMFDRLNRYRHILELISVLMVASLGYIYTLNKPVGFSILRSDTGLIMLPFFTIGRYLPNFFECIEKRHLLIITLIVSLSVNLISGLLLNDLVSVCSNVYGNIFMFYISTISGSIAVFLICKYLEKIKVIGMTLSHYGRYSLSLLCSHVFILAIVIYLFIILLPELRHNPILITGFSLLILYPLIPIFDKVQRTIIRAFTL